MSLKNPLTPPGIDPGTVRLVAQRLNHYATRGPIYIYIWHKFTSLFWRSEVNCWNLNFTRLNKSSSPTDISHVLITFPEFFPLQQVSVVLLLYTMTSPNLKFNCENLTSITKHFRSFPQTSSQIPELCLKLRHHFFFSFLFHFTIDILYCRFKQEISLKNYKAIWSTYTCTYLLIYLLTYFYLLTYLLTTYLFTYLLLIYLLTYLFTYLFIYLLIYLLTYLLTYLLIYLLHAAESFLRS